MEAIENTRGAQLAKQLNLGEVTSWKLHWLVCDLQNLQTEMYKADFGTDADLRTGVFADFLMNLKNITLRFDRLRWEVKTMLGFDYDDEADALFHHVKHYDKYLEEVGNVKTYLEQKARQILEAESERVLQSIQNIPQGV